MPRIGRFPPFGKRFFRRARKLIGSCHFAHFGRVVLALAAMNGRRSLNRIEGLCKDRMVGGKKHRLAQRVGRLSKAGRVKLVFGRRPRETSWIAIAANQTRWGLKTVLSHYLIRWGIEVLFKMSKQYLGLGDYQLLRYRAVERYLHLVLIAHLLLTHLAATGLDAQADRQSDQTSLRRPSVPQMQQQLRVKLWEDTIQSLETGSRHRKLNGYAGFREKGDRYILPERPGGCFAQNVPVPFFLPGSRISI